VARWRRKQSLGSVVENTLSQAIDRLNAVDGDEWFMESAKDVNKACLQSWKDVKKPGDYLTALNRGVMEWASGTSIERKLCNYAEAGAVRFIDRTERAIVHLQDALRKRYGKVSHPLDQGYSDCTLYIAHNEVNLTNENSHVVAEDAEDASAVLSEAKNWKSNSPGQFARVFEFERSGLNPVIRGLMI
jgi:hypothetical protein